MDPQTLRQVRRARDSSAMDFGDELGRTLAEVAGGAWTLPEARERPDVLLQRAREGVPQVVGAVGDAAIVISVSDLARLLRAAVEPTLAEVLAGSGFEPHRSSRIVIGERRAREALKRRGRPA